MRFRQNPLTSSVFRPMYLGGELTKIDAIGKQLVSNDEVIAINQSGRPAKQVLGGDLPVWVSDLGHNTYYVGLFNMNATPSTMHLPWNLLGVTGARSEEHTSELQ